MDWGKYLTRLHGRIGRKSFWLFFGLSFALGAAAMALDNVVLGKPDDGPLLKAVNLAVTYPWICIIGKRLHDLGLSGWWQVLGYALLIVAAVVVLLRTGDEMTGNLVVLLLALVPLVALGVIGGQAGPNRFGEPNSGDRAVTPAAEVFS